MSLQGLFLFVTRNYFPTGKVPVVYVNILYISIRAIVLSGKAAGGGKRYL
ncbi:MAG TPA: hypothetical protein VK074_11105 [Fodinibius sp.]|nr:hypothetical protein [Fodinibius sp.]